MDTLPDPSLMAAHYPSMEVEAEVLKRNKKALDAIEKETEMKEREFREAEEDLKRQVDEMNRKDSEARLALLFA